MPGNLPRVVIANAAAWRQWLANNCSSSPGVFLTIVKEGQQTSKTSLTYSQALDEALCYGWIDSGGGGKLNDISYSFRFTPRRPQSNWSKRNVGFAERLEREGRMQPPGRAAIDAAKADGRWTGAIAGAATDEAVNEGIPDFVAALKKVPAAQSTWDELSKGNRYHIYLTLMTLKTAAARERRIDSFVETLAADGSPLPQKKRPRKSDDGAPSEEKASSKAASKRVRASSGPNGVSSGQTARGRQTRSGRAAPSYKE